jgi:hypothetical protein
MNRKPKSPENESPKPKQDNLDTWVINKPSVSNNIRCSKCKGDSGYTNSDFLLANVNRNLNCKNCGKPCIKVLCARKEYTTVIDVKSTFDNEQRIDSGIKLEDIE